MDQISVGIDVSKATFVVAVAPTGERGTSEIKPAGIDALVVRLQALTPVIIVVEATGGYERALVAALRGRRLAGRRRQSTTGPGLRPGARPHGEDGHHRR